MVHVSYKRQHKYLELWLICVTPGHLTTILDLAKSEKGFHDLNNHWVGE
jgi:hypothetical protein